MQRVTDIPEELEQQYLFAWAAWASGTYPELQLMFHIPNGGKRDIGTAKKLKAQGVKAGVPDIFLPVAKGGFFGMFIEMKREKSGKLSKNQEVVIAELTRQGYYCAVCHGYEAAQAEIEKYLKMTETKEVRYE